MVCTFAMRAAPLFLNLKRCKSATRKTRTPSFLFTTSIHYKILQEFYFQLMLFIVPSNVDFNTHCFSQGIRMFIDVDLMLDAYIQVPSKVARTRAHEFKALPFDVFV